MPSAWRSSTATVKAIVVCNSWSRRYSPQTRENLLPVRIIRRQKATTYIRRHLYKPPGVLHCGGCTWTRKRGACHYLTNRFQMKAPVAPSRSLREAFKRAPRSLRGACLREGFAEPLRRHDEPFAEVYEPFAEVAHTVGSTKTPWRVHEASSKGPWMNCMFLLDHDCNRVLVNIVLFLEQ